MKSYGQTLNLKNDPAVIATYIEHHRRIWPEVAAGLRAIGILNMRIWLLGRRLFMVMDTVDEFDAERDFARYMESGPRIREWQSLMETFQERVDEAKRGEWWAAMDLVFELAKQP